GVAELHEVPELIGLAERLVRFRDDFQSAERERLRRRLRLGHREDIVRKDERRRRRRFFVDLAGELHVGGDDRGGLARLGDAEVAAIFARRQRQRLVDEEVVLRRGELRRLFEREHALAARILDHAEERAVRARRRGFRDVDEHRREGLARRRHELAGGGV